MLALTISTDSKDKIIIQTSDGLISVSAAKAKNQGKITLGLEAPKSIKIDREKIYLRKQATA